MSEEIWNTRCNRLRKEPYEAPWVGTQNADQIKIADFNGDGRQEFVVTHIDLASLGDVPAQLQIFIGDGQGNFTDQSQGFVASAP